MKIKGVKIVAAQYSALLGDETCPLCRYYDGMIFDINDPNMPNPPLHPGCRCILVYIGEDEIPENRKPDGKPPPDDLLIEYAKMVIVMKKNVKQ